jgi:heme exporter protein D
MEKFLAMGGYAGYVWPAYGIAVAVIAIMVATSVANYRRTKRALEIAQSTRKKI